ncbi:MAG TPA: Rieske 2Fe-2S domain-containing protein [Nitrososphaerales archaeon]|nr:Rieske 2Fe-2S domain-containing protein [Nitrososphaerales archaeon]
MPDFARVAEATRVKPGGLLTVEVEGESVLIANVEGRFYAMGAICTHEEWDLSEGSADGHLVTCAGHGSVWDVRTGKAEFDEPLEDEPLFDIKEEDGQLYVRKR